MGEMNFLGGTLLTAGTALAASSFFSRYPIYQAVKEIGAGLGRNPEQILSPVTPVPVAPGILLGLGLVGIVAGTAALLFNE